MVGNYLIESTDFIYKNFGTWQSNWKMVFLGFKLALHICIYTTDMVNLCGQTNNIIRQIKKKNSFHTIILVLLTFNVVT